jgi:hypothetical protein
MADELSETEQALRRLPLPYSLVLRLRDAGVAADVICQYVDVEQAALDGLYRIAEAKLLALQKAHTPATTITTDATDRIRHSGRGPRISAPSIVSTADDPGPLPEQGQA